MATDIGDHDVSTQVNPQQKDGRLGSEGADLRATADVRQLMKATVLSLSSMAMLFDIRKNASKIGKIYSTLTLIGLVGDFGWKLMKSMEMDLFLGMQYNIWTGQAILHFVVFYTSSIRANGVCSFFDLWQEYRDKYNIGSGSVKIRSNICAAVSWILTILCAGFTGYQAFGFLPDHIDIANLIPIIITWVGGFYHIFAWMSSCTFTLLVANLLAEENHLLYKEIQEAIEGAPHMFNQRIGDIRRRHWELCQVIGKADDIISAHVGISFLASVALCCLGLYIIIWNKAHDGNATLVVIQCIWFLVAITKLTSDCVAGVILNDSVRTVYISIESYS